MDNRKSRTVNRKFKKRTKSFTEALKEKYCMDDEPTFDFIIVSPKRKSNAAEAELAHLRTVVLNEMDVTRADIPRDGLTSLCPNVVDLDLANNLLENWHELLAILGHLPRVKYVNVSGNKLRLPSKEILPDTRLSVENLALNGTGSSLEEVVRLSHMMPALKELHLCGNDYNGLADIDQKISDGAFTALECLRLNNNGITDWSEVWKLRNLPQLKYLILSGNPIQDIFYKSKDADAKMDGFSTQSSNATSDVCDMSDAGDADLMDMSVDPVVCDIDSKDPRQDDNDGDVFEREEDIFEGECFQDKSYDHDDAENDEADSSLDDRPVSRFGYHQDPEVVCSDEGSDAEQDSALAPQSSPLPSASGTNMPSGNINIPQATGSNERKVHNTNYNNSRNSRPLQGSPFDDSSSGSSNLTPMELGLPGFPDPLGPAMVTGLGTDSDLEEEDNPGDWPRLAAEQFLYDLIDQLDLEETATPSSAPTTLTTSTSTTASLPSASLSSTRTTDVPQSPSAWYSHRSTSLYQIVDSPSASTISSLLAAGSESVFPAQPLNSSTDTNQNAASCGAHGEAYINKMLAAISGKAAGSDDEEDIFAKIYSDDDFIPRSVSMLDEDDSCTLPSLPLRLTSLTKSRSKAQRCLFGSATPTVPASSASSSSSAVCERVAQSESDSCSDCEAEQHSLTAALRQELADASDAPVRPVDGPNSWLEMNHSFATSVRDSGEGFSITTTTSPAGRVVVTGLNFNTNESACQRSCKDDTKTSCKLKTNADSPAFRSHHDSGLSRSEVDSQANGQPLDGESAIPSTCANSAPPFSQLQMLCLSNASVSQWDHLTACMLFPKLHNIRLKNNPLYSFVSSDDRRKLYIASLPNVTILNGGEVTTTEREKAERFFLRFFMDRPDKPDLYHTLVAKHGPPVKLVDIDLRAGYQEWATLTFKCEGACEGVEHFTRRLHLVEPVSRLRALVAQVLRIPKRCFLLHHHPCGPSHPESEREIVELRCESLPMSRFDFAEGDEIIVEVKG